MITLKHVRNTDRWIHMYTWHYIDTLRAILPFSRVQLLFERVSGIFSNEMMWCEISLLLETWKIAQRKEWTVKDTRLRHVNPSQYHIISLMVMWPSRKVMWSLHYDYVNCDVWGCWYQNSSFACPVAMTSLETAGSPKECERWVPESYYFQKRSFSGGIPSHLREN